MKPSSYLLPVAVVLLFTCSASCITVSAPGVETYYVTEYISENRSEPFTEVITVPVSVQGEDIVTPHISWGAEAFTFQNVKHAWYYGYDLSGLPVHESEKLKIMFSKQQYYEYAAVNVFDMSPRGQILAPPQVLASDEVPPSDFKREMLLMQGNSITFDAWLNVANLKLNYARFLGGRSDLWLNYEGPFTIEVSTRGARDIAVIISGPVAPQNMRFNVVRSWSDTSLQSVTRSGERIVPYQIEKKVAKQRTVIRSYQAPFWSAFLPR